jgi:hypothetical protein
MSLVAKAGEASGRLKKRKEAVAASASFGIQVA